MYTLFGKVGQVIKHCQRHNGARIMTMYLIFDLIFWVRWNSGNVWHLATRWHHLHWFQSWPPGCVTYIATFPWIALLALSVSMELVSLSARVTSVKSQKGNWIHLFWKTMMISFSPKSLKNLEVPGLVWGDRFCPNKCWTRNVVVRFWKKVSRKKGAKCNMG